MHRRFRSPWAWLALALMAGCQSLDDISGTYEGAIIDGNFVRRCFAPGTRASLRFDPEAAVAVSEFPEEPNRLSTDDGTFDETPLVPLSALPHDQLSAFDFPGPARVRNFMQLARPESGPLRGRDVVVIVSILEKGAAELRVIGRLEEDAPVCGGIEGTRGEPEDADYVDDGHEFFGVFQLRE